MSLDSINERQSRLLVAQLRRSQVFRDYEKAFRETTGRTLFPIPRWFVIQSFTIVSAVRDEFANSKPEIL